MMSGAELKRQLRSGIRRDLNQALYRIYAIAYENGMRDGLTVSEIAECLEDCSVALGDDFCDWVEDRA